MSVSGVEKSNRVGRTDCYLRQEESAPDVTGLDSDTLYCSTSAMSPLTKLEDNGLTAMSSRLLPKPLNAECDGLLLPAP